MITSFDPVKKKLRQRDFRRRSLSPYVYGLDILYGEQCPETSATIMIARSLASFIRKRECDGQTAVCWIIKPT